MRQIIIYILAALLLAGCATKKPALPAEHSNRTTESVQKANATDSVIVYRWRDRYRATDTLYLHDSVVVYKVRLTTDTILRRDTIMQTSVEIVPQPADTPKIVITLAYIGGIMLGLLLIIAGVKITKLFI